MIDKEFIKDYLTPIEIKNIKIERNDLTDREILLILHENRKWIGIKDLDYYSFLKTPYWKAVSTIKIEKANFKCQLCDEYSALVTHHKTYENHGYEHFRLDKDLIVLCRNCHEKFHDIKKIERNFNER